MIARLQAVACGERARVDLWHDRQTERWSERRDEGEHAMLKPLVFTHEYGPAALAESPTRHPPPLRSIITSPARSPMPTHASASLAAERAHPPRCEETPSPVSSDWRVDQLQYGKSEYTRWECSSENGSGGTPASHSQGSPPSPPPTRAAPTPPSTPPQLRLPPPPPPPPPLPARRPSVLPARGNAARTLSEPCLSSQPAPTPSVPLF
eukprot:3606133-Pleurochrysis_carterae.AAC.1